MGCKEGRASYQEHALPQQTGTDEDVVGYSRVYVEKMVALKVRLRGQR